MITFVQSVSDCLDRMIEQESRATVLSIFDEFVGGISWFNQFQDLRKLYQSYADPDALALASELSDLFDSKTKDVQNKFKDDPIMMEKLITKISQRRKELGFDEKQRRIKPANAPQKLDRASEKSH